MTSDLNDNAIPMIDDVLLHAFVDGHATFAEIERVTQWLATHPVDAQRVAHWQAQRAQLRLLDQNVLDEPVPAALSDTLRPARADRWAQWTQWSRLAVAAGLVAAGVVGGWMWRGAATEAPLARSTPEFVREARVAHVVYTPEKRHPVEVGAEQSKHLVEWLSRRLGAPLSTPDLGASGFALMGGRLLPGEKGQARAQFMYERPTGERLTLHVSVFAPSAVPAATSFRFTSDANSGSFYWVDGRYGYALTGPLPRAELESLARVAYEQLLPGTSKPSGTQ